MDDAVLDLSIGIDTLNGLREAFEAIYARDEDIFNTTVM